MQKHALTVKSLIMTVVLSLLLPMGAFAGEDGLDDLQNAKLARVKAKYRVEEVRDAADGIMGNEGGGDDEDCGSVNIGNVHNNSPFGGTKENTVIVIGDIINAYNKCK